MTEARKTRKSVTGVVSSDKCAKTITVRAERLVQHPKFGKYVKRYTTYYAHDENQEAHPGDMVELVECRPLSKQKRYRLVRILRRGKAGLAVEEGD